MVIVEVFNKIFIGNIHDANDVYKLIHLNIGGVLSCVYCDYLDWCYEKINDPKIFFKHDFLNCKKKICRIQGNISLKEITEKEKQEENEKKNITGNKENIESKEQAECSDTEHITKDHPDYYFTKCAHYDFIVAPKEIMETNATHQKKFQTNVIMSQICNVENNQTVDFCDECRENDSEEKNVCSASNEEEDKEKEKDKDKEEDKEKDQNTDQNVEQKEKKKEEQENEQENEQDKVESKEEQLVNMLKCKEATTTKNIKDKKNDSSGLYALDTSQLNEYIKNKKTIPLSNVCKIKHLYLDINDAYDENILRFVEQAHEFIDSVVQENKGVLIHCLAGISRSSSIILSYISQKNKKGVSENFTDMLKKYPFAQPNEQFFQQLLLYEKMNYNLNGYSKYHLIFKQSKCKFDKNYFQQLASLNLLNEKDPVYKFQCKFCRFPLFNNNDIVEHDLEKYNIKKSRLKKNYGHSCTSIFIKKPMWLSTEQKMKGVIYCPNNKCNAKLGKWSWTGICCSCGYLQFGAFMINESNVDKMNIEMEM